VTRRPLLVASAATAALALCVASGTASAATSSGHNTGRGTSSLSLLDLKIAGHTLSLADLSLISDTLASPRVSSVAVTPIIADGTAYGRQTVNQSSSPKSIAPVSVPGALAAFAQLTSPTFDVTATSGPSNHAGTSSLGSAKVLGLPIGLAGALQAASAVSTANGASGLKTITIDNLALPSINDILGALGLDLSALPVDALDELVNALELVNGAVATAEGAVDTAQAAVDSAVATLASRTASLTSAQNGLTSAQATLTSATSALTSLIGLPASALVLGPLGITDIATLIAASPANQALAFAGVSGLQAALTTYTNADAAVTAAQTAVATAQGLVNTAQTLLNTVTATLTNALNTLLGALTNVLDKTPLVSLDSLEVSTKAIVTSASKGGQQAEIVGGVVKGLKVLGVDVLDAALGSSTLDLDAVTTSALSEVNGLMDEVTGTLSDVLSSIPSLPALDIPAPNVTLLAKKATTSISGGFGNAETTVRALTISLPAITVPTAVAVPNAANLPALDGVTQTAGKLTSSALSVGVLNLHDQASFSPAAVPGGSAPGTGGHLADTGLPVGLAVLSLVTAAGALLARRRLITLG
jgi:hypothetical protein